MPELSAKRQQPTWFSQRSTQRYIAFLDILGFGSIVKRKPIKELLHLFEIVHQNLPTAQQLGLFLPESDERKMPVKIDGPLVNLFSFSDTFVISSFGDTDADFFVTLASANVLATHLFAYGLPVRGAITFGEAEFIRGTNHLIGKAVVRAAELEKMQEWFGIFIDPDILDEHRRSLTTAWLIKQVVLDYEVPFKTDAGFRNPCKVLNWRFNLGVEKGIKSLFTPSEDPKHQIKIDNTLAFCLWVRQKGFSNGHVVNEKGERIFLPWLRGLWVGQKPPDHPDSKHRDEY